MRSAISLYMIFVMLTIAAQAHIVDTTLPPVIRPGTLELGIDGSLVAIEGVTQVSLMLRGGTFFSIADLTLMGEAEGGYSYTNTLGALDLQIATGITGTFGGKTVWPYLALAGGIRQEWIGSFAQQRYPVGADLGARFLVSRGAGLRVAYRYRMILNDPVSRYSEHRLVLGVSLLLENPAVAGPGD